MSEITIEPMSETAIIVDFGKEMDINTNKQVHQLAYQISLDPFPGFIESVPSYTTLTIIFDPFLLLDNSLEDLTQTINTYLSSRANLSSRAKVIEIPVCYDNTFGFDLSHVAKENKLSEKEVIDLHCKPTYDVYFLGFTPGFPFLAGLNPKIATPRKKSPRLEVPAGSVGIAGNQTGIYPSPSPGGWQIIGRTPLNLLQLDKEPPTIIQPGDQIKFIPISKREFQALWD